MIKDARTRAQQDTRRATGSRVQRIFPESAVHYFVCTTTTTSRRRTSRIPILISKKEAMINAEIDRLRHAATQALLTRKDVIIVASVSPSTARLAGGV